MRTLLVLLIAVTGCGARANAQPIPGDAGMHISDALKRDPITRDANTVSLDAGAAK